MVSILDCQPEYWNICQKSDSVEAGRPGFYYRQGAVGRSVLGHTQSITLPVGNGRYIPRMEREFDHISIIYCNSEEV
jgi:hypothetical protein